MRHASDSHTDLLIQTQDGYVMPVLPTLTLSSTSKMQSPSVQQTLKRRRDLTRAFQTTLTSYQQRHRTIFDTNLPELLTQVKRTEQQRVAATRDCITMYTGSNRERATPMRPFAATLAAAEDVTDACASACNLPAPAPPIPVFAADYSDGQTATVLEPNWLAASSSGTGDEGHFDSGAVAGTHSPAPGTSGDGSVREE